MANGLTLSIHLGEPDLRAIATDGIARGAAVSVALETLSPHEGWAEQRPGDWWDALVAAVRTLGREVALGDVRELRLSAGLQASVFLDGEREVIRPAILARDARAAAEGAAGPLAAHLAWMRRHQAIAFKRVRTALSPKGYLRFRLTGALAYDADDAAATGLFDAGANCWSEGACDALEVSAEILPPVQDARQPTLLENVAAQLGLPAGIPVLG